MEQQLLSKRDPVSIECDASPTFTSWLAQLPGSLAVSTYQAGKLALLSWDGSSPNILLRQFDKPLGLAVRSQQLALATRHEIVLFSNAPRLAPEAQEDQPGRYQTLYLPRGLFQTGDLNIHDLAFGESGPDDLIFVNTRFSCLARPSFEHHFLPIWKPPFISELAPEDRCHLNGLALVAGRPKYVTCLGSTDTAGGWRPNKADGGLLIDVETNETILSGLSMPHSPRWYDGRLWVLNSGAGELLLVDPAARRSEVVCRLPGYLRGLSFAGPFALIGLSKIREKHIFGGLPIQQTGQPLHCGVAAVDIRIGALAGVFEFTAGCEELYDVQFLPGVLRPMIFNRERPVIHEAITFPEASYWLRPSKQLPVDSVSTTAASPEAATIS